MQHTRIAAGVLSGIFAAAVFVGSAHAMQMAGSDTMMHASDTMMMQDTNMHQDTMMKSDTMMASSDLMMGSRGDSVTTLQTFLEAHGFLMIPSGATKGYFGSLTKSAVMKYQQSAGVRATGYWGPLSRAAMSKSMMMQKNTQ